MKNFGKIFEDDFKNSIPNHCLLIRLNDSPQAFTKSNLTRFTHKTPCDFIMFDCETQTLFPIELKTTKYKSMGFEDINLGDEQSPKMIHKHQILGLTKFSKYDNVAPYFVFNFRSENKNDERTYFQKIEDFNNMVSKIDKKSFNEIDLLTVGNAIKLNGNKKRTRWVWNIDKILDMYRK